MRGSLSRKADLKDAIEEAVKAAMAGQEGECMEPDIAIAFCSSTFVDDYSAIVSEIRKNAPSVTKVLGCTGYGIIGNGQQGDPVEVEGSPAFSVTLANFGDKVDLQSTYVKTEALPDGDAPPDEWAELLGVPAFPERNLSFVVLSDPSFLRINELTAGIDYAFPEASVVGGLVSGVSRALFYWDATKSDPEEAPELSVRQGGAIVLALYGDVQMELHIAQ
eukprot:gene13132-3454_t